MEALLDGILNALLFDIGYVSTYTHKRYVYVDTKVL